MPAVLMMVLGAVCVLVALAPNLEMKLVSIPDLGSRARWGAGLFGLAFLAVGLALADTAAPSLGPSSEISPASAPVVLPSEPVPLPQPSPVPVPVPSPVVAPERPGGVLWITLRQMLPPGASELGMEIQIDNAQMIDGSNVAVLYTSSFADLVSDAVFRIVPGDHDYYMRGEALVCCDEWGSEYPVYGESSGSIHVEHDGIFWVGVEQVDFSTFQPYLTTNP